MRISYVKIFSGILLSFAAFLASCGLRSKERFIHTELRYGADKSVEIVQPAELFRLEPERPVDEASAGSNAGNNSGGVQ